MYSNPNGPFLLSSWVGSGASADALRRAVEGGQIRRIMRGVYIDALLPDSIDMRVEAVRLLLGQAQIACDRTAAWLYGIDLFRGVEHVDLPRLETCAVRGRTRTRLTAVRGMTRDLLLRDIQDLAGVAVTTPLRTALDLGCVLRRRDALAALDQFRRLHGLTVEELLFEANRYRGRRGVKQLRVLVPLSDPRAESLRETWTRLAILEAGLPAPEVQFWWKDMRLDLAYPPSRIAVEYDGEEFHRMTTAQLEHDETRRRRLRDDDWIVIVVRRGDFTGPKLDSWLGRVANALRERTSSNRRW